MAKLIKQSINDFFLLITLVLCQVVIPETSAVPLIV